MTTTPVNFAPEGSYIGSYRIAKLLGTGNFGFVYKAYQPFLDREVAVKVIHSGSAAEQDAEQHFMHEARTIARLRHPNIVTVYEFGIAQSDARPLTYMVMEYLSGETLQALLKHEILTFENVVQITMQLADALDYAHSHNVVHRDLKPANITFTDQLEPVIVDFGLAKLVAITTGRQPDAASETATGTTGTPAYMSPEQIVGQPAGPASDQYSLALITYEMLAGQLPFSADGVGGLLRAKLEQVPPPLSASGRQFPIAADSVLQRAMLRNPDARYPNASAFAHALSSALIPNRPIARTITVLDPVQTAQLKRARQTVLGFMWGLVVVTLVVILFCSSLFIRGYLTADSPFIWDGILSSTSIHNGFRDVIALWPGGPASRSGVQIGDTLKADIADDSQRQDGDYQVNGKPRSAYPASWQPQEGDVITRTLIRNGKPVNVIYTLERSDFEVIAFAVQFPAVILAFICAAWLLRRWDAEPGVQIFTLVLMAGSFALIASGMTDVITNIDSLAVFLFLPLLLHLTLVFPETLPYFERHPRQIWFIYLPVPIGLIEFLIGKEIFDKFNVSIYVGYAILLVLALALKWTRRDLKRYQALWLLLAVWVVTSITVLLGEALFAFDDYATVQAVWGGNGLYLFIADYGLVMIGSTVSVLFGTLGLHRVQRVLGKSIADSSSDLFETIDLPASDKWDKHAAFNAP